MRVEAAQDLASLRTVAEAVGGKGAEARLGLHSFKSLMLPLII